MAVVEPGAIARLFVSYVMHRIHGVDAPEILAPHDRPVRDAKLAGMTLKFATLAKAQTDLARVRGQGQG